MEYRIKRKTDDELFHSDEFLGEEFDDELTHWKYIDRYKSKAGKWIYVYENKAKQLWDRNITGKEYLDKAATYSRKRRVAEQSYQQAKNTGNTLQKLKERNDGKGNIDFQIKSNEKWMKKQDEEIREAVDGEMYYKKQYRTKSLAGISSSVVSKGKNFLSKLLGIH